MPRALLALTAALLVVAAGCAWRPALNKERPGVTWSTPWKGQP